MHFFLTGFYNFGSTDHLKDSAGNLPALPPLSSTPTEEAEPFNSSLLGHQAFCKGQCQGCILGTKK